MQYDMFLTLDPNSVKLARAYVLEHGTVAGITIAQFDAALANDSEVPLREREDMVQSIYDEI